MKNSIYFDSRWIGEHGIGRFAAEVFSRLDFIPLNDSPFAPSSPFDLLYSTFRILSRARGNFFSPGYNVPIFGFPRYVFTIHDLNHLDFSENSSTAKRLYYYFFVKNACRHSPCVLTVSEFSRRRILEWSSIPEERVVNVGNGVSDVFFSNKESTQPGYQYFLCVGNRKPHKNELRLLQAFYKARVDSSLRLVFTGIENSELRHYINGHPGLRERVVFLGRLDEADLARWYKGAISLLFPSLYEGFGLPVVEAMACGTPVLTSSVTSLPEVAGNAALIVDPLNDANILEGIERLATDDALRAQLSAKGLIRARDFSWDRVAQNISHALAAAFSG
jgi:glycosyltransferase involved in cell wall biosynthesis